MDKFDEVINNFVDHVILDGEEGMFLNEFQYAEDYLAAPVRISVSNLSNSQQTDYFYYDFNDKTIIEGPAIIGNTPNYSYKKVGMVEFYLIRTTEGYAVGLSRVILPEDEDMSCADEFEQSIFENIDINRFDRFDAGDIHCYRERYREKVYYLSECIDCGKLIFPSEKNLEFDPEAKALELEIDYVINTAVICRDCGKELRVKDFLKIYNDDERINKFEKILKNEYSLKKDDFLFGQD